MTLAHDDDDAQYSSPGILLKPELGDEPHKTMGPLDALDDCGDLDSRLSSLPSTPSTGSTRSKRSSLWNDDHDSELDPKNSDGQPARKRIRSLSPFTASSTISGRTSLSSSDCLPQRCDAFRAFRTRPGIKFVDKTQSVLGFPDKFRYLLLRPPRFGKTTLLSTLTKYYDISEVNRFPEHFGSLAVDSVAPDTAPAHNQHLCLPFTLSLFRARSDITDIVFQLDSRISFALNAFIVKYASQLGLSDSDARDFLGDRSGDIFKQVFNLVRTRDFTLFVTVDDYDGLSVDLSFPAGDAFSNVHEIESLLDSSFWAPLLGGFDIIDKLFITGNFLMGSAVLDDMHLSDLPMGLHDCCGFTEQEALEYARSILGKTPDVEELRGPCGNYVFLPRGAGGDTVEPVLHPQRLINRIVELAHDSLHDNDDTLELLSNILDLLPADFGISGAASIASLIQLLAAGAVECEIDSPFDFNTTAPTCQGLYYAGGLICDLQGALRIASAAVLSMIHSRVDIIFSDCHELWRSFAAWRTYHLDGDIQPFLDCMSEILRDLALMSLGKKHEPNLRGLFELVMRNRDMKFRRLVDPIILLPHDVTRVEIPAHDSDQVHVWELKTVTLRGMWQVTNMNDDEPTIEALEALHEELVDLEEDELLARPYRVWSPTLNAMETVLVSSFFDPEPEVPQFLAVGGVRILMRQRLEEEDEDEGQEEEELDSEGEQEEQEQEDDELKELEGEGEDDICLDSDW
ncbi:hypothetical protein C8R47DRAFT_1100400 [Mycena vitilis]|nr:hypothetical protein C8R47DRAFT_1100400 [Mycena vitilis]